MKKRLVIAFAVISIVLGVSGYAIFRAFTVTNSAVTMVCEGAS